MGRAVRIPEVDDAAGVIQRWRAGGRDARVGEDLRPVVLVGVEVPEGSLEAAAVRRQGGLAEPRVPAIRNCETVMKNDCLAEGCVVGCSVVGCTTCPPGGTGSRRR